MARVFARWKHHPSLEQLTPRLQRWFSSALGKRFLGYQQKLLDEALSHCFGYHLLQLSVDPKLSLFAESRVQKKYRVHPAVGNIDANCNFEQLPFASESLDVVIVHHAHEYVQDPHRMLREIERVLVANGHLIVLGFNPWAPLGWYSFIGGFLPNTIWHGHHIRCHRVKDWLGVLGFETKRINYGAHCPDVLQRASSPRLQRCLKYLPLGNFYLISAVKQVSLATPIKPGWAISKRPFAGLSTIKPRASNRSTKDKNCNQEVA